MGGHGPDATEIVDAQGTAVEKNTRAGIAAHSQGRESTQRDSRSRKRGRKAYRGDHHRRDRKKASHHRSRSRDSAHTRRTRDNNSGSDRSKFRSRAEGRDHGACARPGPQRLRRNHSSDSESAEVRSLSSRGSSSGGVFAYSPSQVHQHLNPICRETNPLSATGNVRGCKGRNSTEDVIW